MGRPADASYSRLAISVSATDDRGLQVIGWEGIDTGDWHIDGDHSFNCNGRPRCSNVWNVTVNQPGSHEIVARVCDTAGQRSTDSAHYRVREGPPPAPSRR